MPLELQIRDSPNQDLKRFGEFVYRVRIEVRPDITLQEAFTQRSIVLQGEIPFLEFDLPAHIVAPGCEENWQKAQEVMRLKRDTYGGALFLISQAIKFGVLTKEDFQGWPDLAWLALNDSVDDVRK